MFLLNPRFIILALTIAMASSCRQLEEVEFRGLDPSALLENKSREILGKAAVKNLLIQKDDQMSAVPGSYRLSLENDRLEIHTGDMPGALYALLDLEDQRPLTPTAKTFSPTFPVRAIKFNLPWSAYRESSSMGIHEETCRDPRFWAAFLDMMLENRFNTLLLYNKHPFPFMLKLEEYPEACPFADSELQEWKDFWHHLLAKARERAIEVFIVNWNIIVSPSFARAHQLSEYNDTSRIVVDYTRKSVTALINEYPDLAGIGVTLADWMNGMSPTRKEKWISDTFIQGMKDANRPVKFLHRSVLSGSSDAMRTILNEAQLEQPAYVEVKFNWSHGHSTPALLITHASEAGEVNTGFWQPAPENYRIQWMIRNEDFFILPWGDPEFIRQHIGLNSHPFVNGYHIGSEGYIPALNYFDKSEDSPEYAFKRQWLFYKLWGRLLYDKNTSDLYFGEFIDQKFNINRGNDLLKSYTYASKMPLMLASFFKSTWDYTLYAEGFLAPMLPARYGYDDKKSPLISLEEMMSHQTLDSNYLSVDETVTAQQNQIPIKPWLVTPEMLADQLFANADSVFALNENIRESYREMPQLENELESLEMWAYLSRYFAHKLLAATLMVQFEKEQDHKLKSQAIQQIQDAIMVWQELSVLGDKKYHEGPYWEGRVFHQDSFYNNFSWKKYNTAAQQDLEYIENFSLK